MGINIKNVEQRFWRTDPRLGRNVYGLVSNDVHVTSNRSDYRCDGIERSGRRRGEHPQ
jgi:hypothetical protein